MQKEYSGANASNKKLPRFLLLIACLFLVGFVVANTLAYQHAYAMMHFSANGSPALRPENLSLSQKMRVLLTGVELSRPITHKQPSVLDENCKTVTIPNGQNASLGAWYCQGKSDSRLVMLFHGYLKDKSSLIDEAKVFLRAQNSVLLVDFRGSGESSESYTTIGYREADDVASAINYASQHYPHEKIILYGQSMGAAAILRAVHSHDIKADAIIIEAVFDSLLNTVKNRFHILGVPAFPGAHLLVFWGGWQAGFNGFAHNPIDYAAAVNSPILFFHGEDDTRVKLSEAHKVYKSVTATKYFSAFPETVHESHFARLPDKWENEVGFFLKAGF